MPLSGIDLAHSAALNRFKAQRLLVVGDIILDRYLWGDVNRISPEAPVPVIVEARITEVLGGALNVARNLVAAGAKAEMVGVIGADPEAGRIRELMAGLKIGHRGVVADDSRPTTLKTRVMSHGQQMFRLDREQTGAYADAIRARLEAALERALPGCAGVIVSDYAKGVITAEFVQRIARLAHRSGIPVVADPKRADFGFYAGADYLTPNLKEATEAAGTPLSTQEDIEREGQRLVRKFKGKGVVITRGHEGVSLIGRGEPAHIPAEAREVFDVTGAGDTFISHFALGLCAGMQPAEAAFIGNAAAGIAVSKLGAVTVAPPELAAALGGGDALSKVRTAEDLRLTLEHLREQSKRIVLTNGCFDLFHAGHVRLLHEARALGDVLVVAVNTDRSVRRIKGKPRPILPQDERAAVLSALTVVDYVVFFEEDSPERLLEQLRPDVLAKGRQPREQEVIGSGIVRSYGGEVHELPLFETSSTGELVRKIRRSATQRRGEPSQKLPKADARAKKGKKNSR